jgi:hypothetical protein
MSNEPGRAPALLELQQWLAASILAPERSEDAASGARDLRRWLAAPADGMLGERLAVYVNGYPARVLEALREVFPALAHIAGSREFAALAERYIAAVELRSYNLNDAGEALADFLRRDELGEKLPLAPDLATLEWRLARAFHASAEPPLEPSVFAGWDLADWDRAVLHFQPSVAVVRSMWPIREVWEARETPRDEIDIDLQDRPDDVFVRRNGLEVECTSIHPVQAEILQALLDGQRLGEVSNRLTELGQEAAEVSTWFAAWMQAGLVVGVGGAGAS